MTILPDIELYHAADDCHDAGFLRLKYSEMIGKYCTDIITVRKAFRRRGIADRLLREATEKLGYFPEPEAILPQAHAVKFWKQYGFETGFNQSILD